MASYDVASNICPALGPGASVFCTTLEEIAFSDEKNRRRRGREGGGGQSPTRPAQGLGPHDAPLPAVLAALLTGLERSGALRAEGVFRVAAEASVGRFMFRPVLKAPGYRA